MLKGYYDGGQSYIIVASKGFTDAEKKSEDHSGFFFSEDRALLIVGDESWMKVRILFLERRFLCNFHLLK